MPITPIEQKSSLIIVDDLKKIEKKNKKKLKKIFSKDPKEACPSSTNKGAIIDVEV